MDESKRLYLMKQDNGLIKIGISDRPESRARSLSCAGGNRVEVLWSIRLKSARSAEKLLHKHYEEVRVRGEWFRLNQSDIGDIKSRDFSAFGVMPFGKLRKKLTTPQSCQTPTINAIKEYVYNPHLSDAENFKANNPDYDPKPMETLVSLTKWPALWPSRRTFDRPIIDYYFTEFAAAAKQIVDAAQSDPNRPEYSKRAWADHLSVFSWG